MLDFWNLIAEVFWSLRYFSSSWVYLDTPSSFSCSSTFKIFSCCCSLISLKAEVSYGWDMAWARQSSCVARRVEWGGVLSQPAKPLNVLQVPKKSFCGGGKRCFSFGFKQNFFFPLNHCEDTQSSNWYLVLFLLILSTVISAQFLMWAS